MELHLSGHGVGAEEDSVVKDAETAVAEQDESFAARCGGLRHNVLWHREPQSQKTGQEGMAGN